MSRRGVEIHTNDVGTFANKAQSGFAADSTSSTDHNDHATSEVFICRHAAQLGFFQRPIFDVERFLSRQRNVASECFGTTHDFDSTVVELGRNTGFGFVLAEGDHSESGDEDNGGVRIAHCRGIRAFSGIVVSGIIGAIFFQTGGKVLLQRGDDIAYGRLR